MVSELCDIEQIRDKLAHHLTGIVLIIIGEGELFIVVKQLLTHVPFHVCSHHMSLIADIVFAQALHKVHDKQCDGDRRQRPENRRGILGEQRVGQCAQNLRIGKIHQADDGGAQQIEKEDCLVGAVVMNKSF